VYAAQRNNPLANAIGASSLFAHPVAAKTGYTGDLIFCFLSLSPFPSFALSFNNLPKQTVKKRQRER